MTIERTSMTQRLLPHSREAVFAAIADPARIGRWWGPNGFTSTIDEFDFREGGYWRFTLHGPDGSNYPNENRFDVIERPVRVVIEHLDPGGTHHFLLSLELIERGPGGEQTLLRWAQTFDTEAHYEKVRDFVDVANEQNLDRLETVLAEG